ncbi:MAG: putative family peptidase [Bryobacterales bacterium]|nr:putative family peptidase [Bryobacterales bacterium]
MRSLLLFGFCGALGLWASDAYPPPRFTQAERVRKLEAALPEIDQIFRRYGVERKIPGMVWGVVIDGKLAHVAASNTAYDADSVFRIASMTKSFTALAVLKLRDEGKLSLEDPVAKWIPEFARMELPTRDSAPLRIRNLMSHSSGLPEDNPWGDQQLAASDADLTEWLRRGIPFSTAPGTRYEYSNYAFGLLGRIVTKASRVRYETYVQREILQKLGMASSTLEYASVPAAKRVKGFRLQPDGTYLEEAPLPHGVFGAMGGMLTSANDLGKYVAFHLSAWPPRDEPENGPVRRSSVREMAHLWTPANLTVRQGQATESGYGYGLRVSIDCRFEHIVGHGGGLPGFGSYMMWLPDYGVGLFAMANLTYVGPSAPISDALDLLQKSGGLQRRELPASPILNSMRDHIASLWKAWDDGEAKQIAAMNFFLDTPVPQRRAEMQKLKDEVGQCSEPGPVMAENWLRGQSNMSCANGTVGAFFTLAPTTPPKLQHLEFRRLASPSIRMGAPTGAPAGVSCSQ